MILHGLCWVVKTYRIKLQHVSSKMLYHLLEGSLDHLEKVLVPYNDDVQGKAMP